MIDNITAETVETVENKKLITQQKKLVSTLQLSAIGLFSEPDSYKKSAEEVAFFFKLSLELLNRAIVQLDKLQSLTSEKSSCERKEFLSDFDRPDY